MKPRLLILAPLDEFPVPAVKGGAVQTLIDELIGHNEEQQAFDIEVLSLFNPAAREQSACFRHTKVRYVRKPRLVYWADRVISAFLKKLGKTKLQYCLVWQAIAMVYLYFFLVTRQYHAVLVENARYLLQVFQGPGLAKRYAGKLYFHLHNDIPAGCPKSVLKRCKFILISEYLRRGIEARYPLAVAQDRIRVVLNGIDVPLFSQTLQPEESDALKRKHSIPTDRKIIIYSGRFAEKKGIRPLLEGFQKANRRDAILLIVGSSAFGADIKTQFEQEIKDSLENMGDSVICTGFVAHSEIWKYYRLADLAILPSVWQEPAGLTMVEATVCATPLITTRSGGIPEYISEDAAIILENDETLGDEIAKAINRVFCDYEYYKRRALEYGNVQRVKMSSGRYCAEMIQTLQGVPPHYQDRIGNDLPAAQQPSPVDFTWFEPHASTRYLHARECVSRADPLPELYGRKEECCGCGACYAVCPMSRTAADAAEFTVSISAAETPASFRQTGAITMLPDEKGFFYPVVDAALCIRCYQCVQVCAMKA